MRGVISAPASSPSEPHDTPLTASGGRAYLSVTLVRLAWRGNQECESSRDDSEESVRPSVFGGVTPINQRHSATQHVGCKLANELLSLVSFPQHALLSFLKVCSPVKSAMIQMSKTQLYPSTLGLPELG
jgi:hypothetical protein